MVTKSVALKMNQIILMHFFFLETVTGVLLLEEQRGHEEAEAGSRHTHMKKKKEKRTLTVTIQVIIAHIFISLS